MPRLRTLKGHTLNLPPGRVSIGESAANEIPIAAGNGLAQVHFHLQPWESGYFIEDAGSGLGTLVNGSLVKWAPLKHGDVIAAGELKMIYDAGEGEPPPVFPSEVIVPEEILTAMTPPPPPATAPEQPPSWLPPEALLPPLTPVAQAAIRAAQAEKKIRRPWLLPLLLLLGAALAAGWYFFLR